MNAEQLLNAALAILVIQHVGMTASEDYTIRTHWDQGEAAQWLQKIAGGLSLGIEFVGDRVYPVLR